LCRRSIRARLVKAAPWNVSALNGAMPRCRSRSSLTPSAVVAHVAAKYMFRQTRMAHRMEQPLRGASSSRSTTRAKRAMAAACVANVQIGAVPHLCGPSHGAQSAAVAGAVTRDSSRRRCHTTLRRGTARLRVASAQIGAVLRLYCLGSGIPSVVAVRMAAHHQATMTPNKGCSRLGASSFPAIPRRRHAMAPVQVASAPSGAAPRHWCHASGTRSAAVVVVLEASPASPSTLISV